MSTEQHISLDEMTEAVRNWFRRNLKGDPIIWCTVILLALAGIWVVYSASGSLAYSKAQGNTEYFLVKQIMYVALCLLAMWVAHKIDYRYYSGIARVALWISVPLLIISFRFGVQVNEASRWLVIPVINQSFQPSDLAKFALIASLASMLAKRQHNIENVKESLIPILIWSGVICGLIALSNLSTAVLLFATCMLLMFIGRVPVKYLLILTLVGVLFGGLALAVGQRGQTAKNRIVSFLDEDNIPFQLEQSYIAIATGGLAGKGPGNSSQRNFLPLAYADFVFAIIVEEYGLIGGALIIFLYLVLLYRGMIAVANSERAFGGLLSAGLSFSLVIQAMINMGVTVGLGPVTGQTLPLISMGGTSLLFTGISLGIIISVSRGEGKEEIYKH